MRFDCGPTYAERITAKECWHRFYAIFPRRVGSHDCRYMEWVERKGEYHSYPGDCYFTWEYRPLGSVGEAEKSDG